MELLCILTNFLTLFNYLGADLDATLRAIRSGKVTDEEVNKLMTVFQTSGNFNAKWFIEPYMSHDMMNVNQDFHHKTYTDCHF